MSKSKAVPVVCQNPRCHKTFTTIPSRVAQGLGKYCSRACRYAQTPEDRFWEGVAKGDGCWEWQKSLSAGRYGSFKVNGSEVKAHRFSYELHHGPIPDGLVVCHKCDNPLCVNPDHLFLGTMQDNMQDMVQKGRHKPCSQKGEQHSQARLTAEKVFEIRALGRSGWTHKKIAQKYGLSSSYVCQIINRVYWSHI